VAGRIRSVEKSNEEMLCYETYGMNLRENLWNDLDDVAFEVLTAVAMKSFIFREDGSDMFLRNVG
jgi:hypothetical protein